ncbi:GNAT family N-acetyltransferase [Rhizobium sp. L9]|uniref:GNAT family N-acetyltransferase n=1 Tax=Rhizobium sp. L9 TaxID=1340738 RepID=UPI000BE98558|nr:GNAT family N-acetyltransferase [Rhizobium sp. L9]PDT30784.1 GNAT family N-acetyltransferase [Rhizobium sp. L9]
MNEPRQNDLRVVQVSTPQQWEAYHEIRRSVLFDVRGLAGYDANHPDDRMPGHLPMLLMIGSTPVGAARLDLIGDNEATVRTVAIHSDFQRRGLGRALMKGLDEFAALHGIERLMVHAARDAVGFYEALGWTIIDAARENPVLMKELRGNT